MTVAGFSVDAVTASADQHDRTLNHSGTQNDLVIALDQPIDRYTAGLTLHEVLADLLARASALTPADRVAPRFGASAFVQPYFSLEAIVASLIGSSFGLSAFVSRGASFAFDALLKGNGSIHLVRMDAHIADYVDAYRNLVRYPIDGVANYSSPTCEPNNIPYTGPQFAADGLKSTATYQIQGSSVYGLGSPVFRASQVFNDFTLVEEWPADPTWICTWSVPQTINVIKFYDGGGHTDQASPYDWYWGNTGTIEFSDGSVINWTGLPSNGFHVEAFAPRTVTWFKITSTDYDPNPLNFSQAIALVEVEAFYTG